MNPPIQNQKPSRSLLEMLKALRPEEVRGIPALCSRLTPDELDGLYEYLDWEQASELPERHESRMRTSMGKAASALGLRWDKESPTDHPFGAKLDGALWLDRKRIAVVELEAKNRKQIDGSLLDLLTHPENKKVLVIGRSKMGPPKLLTDKILGEVLPTIQALLKTPADIGIFSETQLNFRPELLRRFLGL
jgi:hypothetical protein